MVFKELSLSRSQITAFQGFYSKDARFFEFMQVPWESFLPVVFIPTIDRVHHFTRLVKSIEAAKLSEYLNVFIYIDGPRGPADIEASAALKKVILHLECLASVTLIHGMENMFGVGDRYLFCSLLNRFGGAIFLEDDNRLEPAYFEWILRAMRFAECDASVACISTYTWPSFDSEPNLYPYLSPRFSGWGAYLPLSFVKLFEEINIKSLKDLMSNKEKADRLAVCGNELKVFFGLQASQRLDAGDVVANFALLKHDLSCLIPPKSLLHNDGHDGSGVHCAKTNRFLNRYHLTSEEVSVIQFDTSESGVRQAQNLRFFDGF